MARSDERGSLPLEEQAALTLGAGLWTTHASPAHGIRGLRLADGPNGVRKPHEGNAGSLYDSIPATCFPCGTALGSSWDRALVERVGEALGREAAAVGVDVLLAPGLNLKRSPLGGRNFEYLSEDPLLTARLGTAIVRGVQSTGVGACVKHFAANDTEDRRYGIDVRVDERALRELSLAAFEQPIREGRPATVMAAYNKLNGLHCTEHSWLLTDLLRTQWGYDGAVVSDWGASWDRRVSVPAGLDLEMPAFGDDPRLARAVRDGSVAPAAVASAATRIAELAARPAPDASAAGVDRDAHHELARRAAAAATVLLQNTGDVLPLAPGSTVALIGAFAASPRYQAAGSSHVVPTRLSTLRAALEARLGDAASYAPGYDPASDEADHALIRAAVDAAAAADVAVVVIGLPESFETEGVDRPHLKLPAAHEALLRAVIAANPRVVVVLQNGSPVELPWRRDVPAILATHLGGQAGGEATADVLLGDREPGGRLAETYPVVLEDHPAAIIGGGVTQLEYRESVYLGYRFFDSADADVAYPFGHGGSYTTFAWSDLDVLESAAERVRCSIRITNTGERRGSEVVQLYVHPMAEAEVFRPAQELRGFEKVELEAGESVDVLFDLDRRAFAYWDVVRGDWVVEAGPYELRAAASSRDVRSRAVVDVSSSAVPSPRPAQDAYRGIRPRHPFSREAFAALDGRALPADVAPRPGEYTLDTSLQDMDGSRLARGLHSLVRTRAIAALGIPDEPAARRVAARVVGQFTPRMLPTVTGGAFSRRQVEGMLRLINLIRLPRFRRLP